MTETIEREYEILDIDVKEETFVIVEKGRTKFTFTEALAQLTIHENKLSEVSAKIEELDNWVEKEGWKDSKENMLGGQIESQKSIDAFTEALKPYFEAKKAEGISLIKKFKRKDNYDRSKGDVKNAKRSAIMAHVAATLGFKDVAHPFIMELRNEFEKIK